MTLPSLTLKYKIVGSVLFVDKIAGLNTHAPDMGKSGVVELLQKQLKKPVLVVSRLDKGTSGALVFALDPETAKKLTQKFEKHEVKKTYVFLTHKPHAETEFTHESFIEKDGSNFTSDRRQGQRKAPTSPNSKTHFTFLKAVGDFYLWQAQPQTGKPHQIRLHAQDCGIPVLGDLEHGGNEFYRLCLHSQELNFELDGQNYSYTTQKPVWQNALPMEDLQLFECLMKRQNLLELPIDVNESFRWAHQEIPDYRVDQFGSHLWVYWYGKKIPTPVDLQRFEILGKTLNKKIWIREMQNRGASGDKNISTDQAELWPLFSPENRWQAQENGVKFELRSDQGMSPGLFLDQRDNRAWVRENSKDKKVLNLFSYTGGFTVNAALGGASETCTVDVSKKYLDWSRENLRLNGVDDNNGLHQFWEADCLFFLKSCIKKGRKFDLIVCDPPSLGRSKEGTFQIQKQLPELVEGCLKCLNPGGQLLFSTNYEAWTLEDLQKNILIYRTLYTVTLAQAPGSGLDFELPGEAPLMKSVIVKRGP